MNVSFNKVIMHNFLSFGHAEIDLNKRNYCMVKGINNCPMDNAVSNGSGKSSFISAICWALTGETVQGVTSNIKNIFVDENSCYVSLSFDVDGDSYEITRTKEPAPNLRIIRNGSDVSGKGLRESNAVLAQYLPDLNISLLTSVILLGQGLPNKFTDNTPSGRKEVLEKLSKSDFIIEGIKERIVKRQSALNASMDEKNAESIKNTAAINLLENSIQTAEAKLLEARMAKYDDEIARLRETIFEYDKAIASAEALAKSLDDAIDGFNVILFSDAREKANKSAVINEEYLKSTGELKSKKAVMEAELKTIETSLRKMAEHPDICPTCGQRMPNADHLLKEKEDNESKKSALIKSIAEISDELKAFDSRKAADMQTLNESFDNRMTAMEIRIKSSKDKSNATKKQVKESRAYMDADKEALSALIAKKEGRKQEIAELEKEIDEYKRQVFEIKSKEATILSQKGDLQLHIDTVKRMDTLVKRDFRGFLLSNIIEFIDKQAKEYSSDLFGTDELDFRLSGNNIDIEYCGKDFASLSGGEKQRVDIIIQFAIRKMMSQYLDFNSNILCLDEVFDNLDAKATSNVISLISGRLTDIESVFIISHHADELAIPYDSTITIVKNAEGISAVA